VTLKRTGISPLETCLKIKGEIMFGRKERAARREAMELPTRSDAIYSVLENGIKRMQREGVDRCVMHVQPLDGDFEGGFFEKLSYYPEGILTNPEKQMTKDKKSYAAWSLITGDVGGMINYRQPSIEQSERRILKTAFVPWDEKYVNKYVILEGENGLNAFARGAAEDGATGEEIENGINSGIKDYHSKTIELMDKAGVYKWLESRPNRYIAPDDPHLIFEG